MATGRKKPASKPPELGPPAAAAPDLPSPNDPDTYNRALHELGITVPVAACRLVGSRLEFRLYGGRVVYWPLAPGDGGGPNA